MRSTTVGWFTSMLRVLPVNADQARVNNARPELRDSSNDSATPRPTTPTNNPERSEITIAADAQRLAVGGEFGTVSEGMFEGSIKRCSSPVRKVQKVLCASPRIATGPSFANSTFIVGYAKKRRLRDLCGSRFLPSVPGIDPLPSSRVASQESLPTGSTG